MISFEQARKIVFRHVALKKPQRLSLIEARGLVLAEDVRARLDGPAFNRSVMDGFAVRARDAAWPGAVLKIAGVVLAGGRADQRLCPGEAIQVATGAELPPGADAVVAKEDADAGPQGRVKVLKKMSRGEYVYFRGSDFKKGSLLLKKGEVLGDVAIALLASQGIVRVLAYPRPRVALISTGDEVVEPGRPLRSGQIWNATAPMLLSMLRSMGIEAVYLGIAPDQKSSLKNLLRRGLAYDVLLVTGAVSVGARDFAPGILAELGVKTLFHKVRMRPGKPLLFGRRLGCMVFGLPGNPLSTWIGFSLFVKPALLASSGLSGALEAESGHLARPAYNESGRLSFLPARLQERGLKKIVYPLPYSGSADLLAASRADVFFILEASTRQRAVGSRVDFMRVRV